MSIITCLFCRILRKMSAKFEVNDLFLIKGRGHVIAGWVLEGVVKIGMSVSMPMFPQKLVIKSIEMINTFNGSTELTGIVGLLVPFGSGQEELLWQDLDIRGQILDVQDINVTPSVSPK